MSKDRIIELLLRAINIMYDKDNTLTIVEAMNLMRTRTELKALGIDLNKYLN